MITIPILKPFMPHGIINKLEEVLYSGWIGEGPKVKEFEKALEKYFNNKRIVCVNSGTSALWISCKLSGLKKGDKVISTPMTCSATNIPFLHFGAKIIWTDVNKSGNMDISSLRKKAKENPDAKLICVVNYGGRNNDIRAIGEIAQKYSMKIIEDAAQSIGSIYDKEKSNNISDFICYSLQAVKTITSVDGGILCLKTEDYYMRARKLRWFGIDRDKKHQNLLGWEYDINEAGYKMHMNDISATIGIEQLKYLDELIHKQQENAKYYNEHFRKLKNIKVIETNDISQNSYWLYILLVKERDRFIKIMTKNGIAATPLHIRNDLIEVFGGKDNSLKGVDYFYRHSVCIPVGYWVTEKNRDFIIKTIMNHFD